MAIGKNLDQDDSYIVRFCKVVLGWDYFRLVTDSKGIGDGKAFGLKKVKDTYEDVDDYISTYEPLLFEEVKAQIIQGQNKEDEVIEWRQGAIKECEDNGEFYFPSVVHDSVAGEFIAQNDLLLLSKEKFDRIPTSYAFAMVEHRVKADESMQCVRLRMYLNGEDKQSIDENKSLARVINMRSLVSRSGSSVYILKICSLSTIFREYVALQSVGSLPFKDLILKAPKEIRPNEKAWRVPGPLMDYIRTDHNESQQGAICEGLSRKPFVLIQGPPGTGKTQTILGLLSALLHSTPGRVQSERGLRGEVLDMPIEEKFNHWAKACPWLTGMNPRDELPTDGGDFPINGNELKPEVIDPARNTRVRVLVCAPSNNALDEIVLRILSTGVRDQNNRAYNPKIVRVGLKPHHSVEAVSMDKLVEQKRREQTSDDKPKGGALDFETIRAQILDEAAIVFSTLGFSGAAVSKLNRGFDVVIIDEAAQAVEPSTLVPLVNGCKQVFLIGDPEQLPATVISPVAVKFEYGKSLFKRFQSAGYEVKMLQTQYRMHPEIRSFPSKEFYHDALEDGDDIVSQTKRPWHRYKCFGPFCFFDIHEGVESERSGKGSWVNEDEAEFVIHLHERLVSKYADLKSSSRLAIISPYKHQVSLLRERFKEKYKSEASKIVDINTVDGFQGREKDVAIFSCVRANRDGRIGFLSDSRRMNVGITRARSSILVVGSASTLKKGDEHWKNLVQSAETVQREENGETKTVNCFLKVSKPYAVFFRDENLNTMLSSEFPAPKAHAPVKTSVVVSHNNETTDAGGMADDQEAADDYGEADGGGYDDDGGGFDED
uniref:AAA+ ATPase domain-containing protein n=1 Tax=Kalanchoe fedtschenkoi TaxID=63787 RepID=A0A7N0T4L7_KALFE